MSALHASAVVLPAWEREGVAVEGPDEDAFTLLVRVGELLRRNQPALPRARVEVQSIRLIASLPGEERSQILEAWGLPAVEITPYPETPEGAARALSDALDEGNGETDGISWVLTAQLASPAGTGIVDPPLQSAIAVGLAFARGREITTPPSPGETHGPTSGRAPSSWVTGSAAKGGQRPTPFAGPPGYRAPPDAPATILLSLVDAASRSAPEALTHWVHATAERTTVRTVLDGRKVPIVGYPVEEDRPWLPVPDEAWRARAGAPISSLSQGAYLSRESYRASLPGRWRLEGERCGACGGFTLPPAGHCHHCGTREKLRRDRLPRSGAVIESATVIRKGAQPTEFDWHQETYGNYTVGLLRFPDGPTLTFQVTDQSPAVPALGAQVELVLRRLYPQEGTWRYGLKAVVLEATAAADTERGAREGRAEGARPIRRGPSTS